MPLALDRQRIARRSNPGENQAVDPVAPRQECY